MLVTYRAIVFDLMTIPPSFIVECIFRFWVGPSENKIKKVQKKLKEVWN